jgi:hypothetical protein
MFLFHTLKSTTFSNLKINLKKVFYLKRRRNSWSNAMLKNWPKISLKINLNKVFYLKRRRNSWNSAMLNNFKRPNQKEMARAA